MTIVKTLLFPCCPWGWKDGTDIATRILTRRTGNKHSTACSRQSLYCVSRACLSSGLGRVYRPSVDDGRPWRAGEGREEREREGVCVGMCVLPHSQHHIWPLIWTFEVPEHGGAMRMSCHASAFP